MSGPVALAPSLSLPSSPTARERQTADGENRGAAFYAPTTPNRRVAVVDKSRVDPQILKAAEGMEAMFMDMLMKTMRQTVPKNEMDLESPATDIYRSMLDSEYAQKAVRAGGVGLADQIVAYLEAQRYNPKQGPSAHAGTAQPTQAAAARGATSASTGGTRHEGESTR